MASDNYGPNNDPMAALMAATEAAFDRDLALAKIAGLAEALDICQGYKLCGDAEAVILKRIAQLAEASNAA